MAGSKLSIALCTHNGAAWVAEQLDSLTRQTRMPDELIICDDASADQTPAILHEFARNAPFRVQVHLHPENIGTSNNFSKAIELCTGDLIALCDQDDRWQPRKLELLEQRLLAEPQLGLVFCDAHLVNHDLAPLGVKLWDTLYLDPLQRDRLTNGQAIGVLARVNVVTGATLMFRGRYKEVILPISPHWIHDGWIALMVLAVSQCGMVDEPLIEYRQHPRQQVGARKSTLWHQVQVGLRMDSDYFKAEVCRWTDVYQRLLQHADKLRYPRDLELIAQKLTFSRDRYQMRVEPGGRWNDIGRYWQAGHYKKMAWGWKSLLQDVVIIP